MERIIKLLDLLKDAPNDYFLRHALALEYIKAGELIKAKQLFENILNENPDYTGSYYHLAKLYETLGQTKSAENCYMKGMEITKKNNDTKAYNELQSAFEEFMM